MHEQGSETLFQEKICANHNFQLACVNVSDNVIMAQNSHQTLQEDDEEESNDKGEVVLEPHAHDDLPLGKENEEAFEEEKIVSDPMDVHIFSIDDMVSSNVDFQEQNSFFS